MRASATESKTSEKNRIQFLIDRDGLDVARVKVQEMFYIYRKCRTDKNAVRNYGSAFKAELVASLVVLRRYLRGESLTNIDR